MKRAVGVLLAAAVLLGGSAGAIYLQRTLGVRAGLTREGVEMAPEVARCGERLRQLHRYWAAYREAHGSPPRSFAAFLAGRKDAALLLMCPTAERLAAGRRRVPVQVVELADGEHQATYLLQPPRPYREEERGGSTVVLKCPVHHLVVARYVFLRDPERFTVPAAAEAHLQELGATGRVLAILEDGRLVRIDLP
jgi:hypothetical protein